MQIHLVYNSNTKGKSLETRLKMNQGFKYRRDYVGQKNISSR